MLLLFVKEVLIIMYRNIEKNTLKSILTAKFNKMSKHYFYVICYSNYSQKFLIIVENN